MDIKTIVIIACGILYVGSTIYALPLIKKLSEKGFYRIPFIPLPKFFIRRHGQEVYDENKVLINKILGIKWISTLSILGICLAIVSNRL